MNGDSAWLSATYSASLAGLLVIGLAFPGTASRIVALSGEGVFHCRDLMSSGSDDDVGFMVASLFFALPLLVRLGWARRPLSSRDTAAMVSGLVMFWLFGTMLLECGSRLATAFVGRDPWMLSHLLLQAVCVACLLWPRGRTEGVA